MNETEHSKDQLIAIIETKIDQLLNVVQEIKGNMNNTTNDVSDLKLKINSLENKNDQQQKEIDTLTKKNEANRNWIMGVGASVVGGIVIALIKFFTGI